MSDDNSFSTFMFGMTLGVIGTLLLGTEEGRRTTRRLLKSVSEGLEKNEDLFLEVKNIARQAAREVASQFKQSPSGLPDQSEGYHEPSPPPPYFDRLRSNSAYFHTNNTEDI